MLAFRSALAIGHLVEQEIDAVIASDLCLSWIGKVLVGVGIIIAADLEVSRIAGSGLPLVAEIADFPDDENARVTADAEIYPMGMVSCESDIAVIDPPMIYSCSKGKVLTCKPHVAIG